MSKRSPERETAVGDDQQPPVKAQRQDPPAGSQLDPSVVSKLNELYESGVCTQGDVDARAIEHLKGFPPATAVEILDQFKNTDLSNVRNRSAYLSGVMGRFRRYDPESNASQDRGAHGAAAGSMRGGDDRTSSLPRMMQRRLDEIYQRRGLDVNTLDQRCLNALGQLPVNAADEALDQLESQDLAQIRSVPAWFMSIIKRANTRHSGGQGGYRTGPGEYGRGAGGGPIGGGHHGPPPAGMMGGVAPFGGPQPPPSDRYGPPPPRPPPRAGGSGDFGSSGYRNDRFDGPPPPGDFGMGMGMMGVGIQGMPGPGYSMGPPGMPPPRMGPGPPMGMGMMAPGAPGDRSMEQIALGVRVDEFHNLSMHAPMVHAAPALKLQQLWDDGCRLVSLLDDRAWEALAALGAPEALVVIDEVAENMIRNADNIRNINAFFMSIANKYLRPGGDPPRAGGGVSGGYGDRPGGGRPGARDFDADNRDHRAGGRFDGRGDRDSRPPRNDGPGDLSTVSQAVRQKIDLLISRFSRYLNRGHFDSGVINALKQIGDEGALQVLDEIASNDLGNVRNPPGYMMGIISRYLRGDRQQRGGGGQV